MRRLPVFLIGFALLAGACLRLFDASGVRSLGGLRGEGRPDYYEFGRSLRDLGVMGWGGQPSAFRGIVYPAFLSYAEDFDPRVKPRSPSAEALLGSLEIPLAAWAAWELMSPWAGAAAALLVAFHPALSAPGPYCRIEPLYGLLILLCSVSMIAWLRHPTGPRAAAFGFATAVSLLCRSALFLLPPVLLLGLGWAGGRPGRRGEARLRPGHAWIVLGCSYLFLLPWIGRNAYQFNSLVVFEQHAATRNLMAASMGIVERRYDGGPQDRAYPSGEPFDRLGAMRSEALANIAARPLDYLRSCGLRLAFIAWKHAPVLLFAAMGLFFFLRRDPAGVGLGLLVACYYLVHVPMTIEARYLEPVLPSVLILAACGVAGPLARAAGASRSAHEGAHHRTARLAMPAPAQSRVLAIVLLVAVPLYVLGVGRLAAEVLLSWTPCSLPRGALTVYRCLEKNAGTAFRIAWPGGITRAEWEEALELSSERGSGTDILKARILTALAALDLADGRDTQAAGRLAGAARDQPEEVRAAALRLQDQGRVRDAAFFFERLVWLHPKNPEYLCDRGVASVLSGRGDDALGDFTRATELDSGDARAWLGRASTLLFLGRRGEARESCRRALDLSGGEQAAPYAEAIKAQCAGSAEDGRGM